MNLSTLSTLDLKALLAAVHKEIDRREYEDELNTTQDANIQPWYTREHKPFHPSIAVEWEQRLIEITEGKKAA